MIRLGARRKAEDQGAVGWGECSPVAMGKGTWNEWGRGGGRDGEWGATGEGDA